MNLKPDEARKLANVLLDSHPGLDVESAAGSYAGAAAGGGGRLAPGPFGRYRITRLVGIGGMGEVYEAEQENPARKVAIKVVRPELVSAEALRRFEHETRVLARLQHPGIAPIYEAGQVACGSAADRDEGGRGSGFARQGTPFFAMEFVDGTPLTSFATDRKLALKARLELFLQICDAVEHAHRKGVIHRDLKPANLLVDAAGRPRVMDFGLARATDADIRATTMHTEIGKLIGTLPYMSPEQVSGDPDSLDTRSDVYSLGVVLYELLGGRLPYAFKSDGRVRIPEAVRAIQESEPAPLSSIDRSFRGDPDTIVAKALAKEKERRYQSVGELAADIRRYLSDEPIVARRAGTWYQMRKLARRNRKLAIVSTVALAALVATTGTSVVFAVQQRLALTESHLARLAEAEQRALAEQREQEASLVLAMLKQAFVSPDPALDGLNVRVVDVLAQAEASLVNELAGHPEAAAYLGASIGNAYLRLGDYESAERCFRQASELWRDADAMERRVAIETLIQLSLAVARQGRLGEAVPLIRDAAAAAEHVLGRDSNDALAAQANLAGILMQTGELHEAEEAGRVAYAAHLRVHGPDHRQTLATLDNLAAILARLGKTEEAAQLYEESFERTQVALGPDHPDTLAAMSNFAQFIMNDDPARAVELLEVAIAGRTEMLGRRHPRTLTSIHNLGTALTQLGEYDQAELLLSEALEARVAGAGVSHPNTLYTRHTFALLRIRQGRHAEAEQMMQEVLEARRATRGDLHPEVLTSLRHLAGFYRVQGRFEEAQQHYADAANLAERLLGPNHLQTGRALIRRGECLVELGLFAEAEPVLRAGVAAMADSPRAGGLAHAHSMLAEVYDELGDPTLAAEHRSLALAHDAGSTD